MKQMKYYSKKLVAMGLAVLFMVASMGMEVPADTEISSWYVTWGINYYYGAPSNVSNQGSTTKLLVYDKYGYYEVCDSLTIDTNAYLTISVSSTTSDFSMTTYKVRTTGRGIDDFEVMRASGSNATGVAFLVMATSCTRCVSEGRIYGY